MYHWRPYIIPALATLLLHALVALLIGQNWSMQSPKRDVVAPVTVVKASLVSLKQPAPKPKPRVKPKPAVKAKPKPTPVVKEKVEPKIDEQIKADLERKRAEEQKRVAEEQVFSDMMAREDAEFQADEDMTLLGQYFAQIQAAIASQWSRPPSARRDMEVLLAISFVPNGDVVSVSIVRSSGNAAFDRSAELAVQKVGRFDMLQGMPGRLFESYFRQVEIKFRPDDLRL